MQLLQTVTPLISLTFSRCIISRCSSSSIYSASKIATTARYSLATGISLALLLTVTTVTNNLKMSKNIVIAMVSACDSWFKKCCYCHTTVTHCNRIFVTVKINCNTTVTVLTN